MNAKQVRDDLLTDLQLSTIIARQARPPGLTFSALGYCHAKAGYLLNGVSAASSDEDWWRGFIGTAIHEAVQARRPDWDAEKRVSITLAGVEISGAYDGLKDGVIVELKTAEGSECVTRGRIGATPNHRMQVAAQAVATGASSAWIAYLPKTGGLDDVTVIEVDIAEGIREAEQFVYRVVNEDQESLPRDVPYTVCQMQCPFFAVCRPGYTQMDDEVTRPDLMDAMALASRAREVRLAAEKEEKGAKLVLAGIHGWSKDGYQSRINVSKDGRTTHIVQKVSP